MTPAAAAAPISREPAPAFQSSLVAAIGRLQVKFAAVPAVPPVLTPSTAPAQPARPILFLGPIPLGKSKSKKRAEPADQQVIPLVLPDFIDPQEVRGRVRQHAEEIDLDATDEAGVASADAPPPTGDSAGAATGAFVAEAPAAPVEASAEPAPGDTQVPAANAADRPKILVRPGPDPVAPKPADGGAAPEETVEERIARIKHEDEEMRSDERRVLKISNDVGKLSSMVEVVLFQNAKPLTINQIARALPGKVNPKPLRQSLQLVADRFDRGEHPIELVEIAGGWQLVVRSGFQELIESFSTSARKRTLTGSIMETLAIIAYRQGTTKIEIETLRGINDCGPHLRQLIEMGLVSSGRRTDLPGSPMGYWTAPLFMRAVGIRSLEELSKMGEFTPTEVAGLVEMEAPDNEAEELVGDSGDSTAAASDQDAPVGDGDGNEATEPVIDPDAIDAAMNDDDNETDADDADEADSDPESRGADLFGEAVVIPVDPADATSPIGAAGESVDSSADDTAPAATAKRARKRRNSADNN